MKVWYLQPARQAMMCCTLTTAASALPSNYSICIAVVQCDAQLQFVDFAEFEEDDEEDGELDDPEEEAKRQEEMESRRDQDNKDDVDEDSAQVCITMCTNNKQIRER
jgi:hypothetical protein